MNRIDVVLSEGFADWEPALLLAQLRRSARTQTRVATFDGAPVTSLGGLTVAADVPLSQLTPEGARLLLLPGGDAWERSAYPTDPLSTVLTAYLTAEVPIGAICGATVALARAGIFANRAHTSNHPDWLAAVAPDYPGQSRYDHEALVVIDQGVVTASGAASTAFAAALLAELDVLDAETLRVWEALYTTGRFPDDANVAAFFTSLAPRT